MDSAAAAAALTATPSSKEINQETLIKALGDRLKAMEKDAKDRHVELAQKADRIRKLEAELAKLKAERTDDQLATEVKSLRLAVSAKDKSVVELQRLITNLKDAEKVALNRAKEAERKTPALETTIQTMQKARDMAQERAAASESAFREAHAKAADLEAARKADQELAKAALAAMNKIVFLAEQIVKKSPSLNRNESEVKVVQAALVEARGAKL